MRGRLIFRLLATIAPIDTAAMDAGGNYDSVFRTVRKVDSDDDGIGETQRLEGSQFTIPCQVGVRADARENPSVLGNVPEHDRYLVMHFKDLESRSLVHTDGRPMINVGDRLVSLLNVHGTLVETIPDPPGLYVVEARPLSYGLGTAPTRNILFVFLQSRDPAKDR